MTFFRLSQWPCGTVTVLLDLCWLLPGGVMKAPCEAGLFRAAVARGTTPPNRCRRGCLAAPKQLGAGRRRSLEMTSPGKCSSDSSPARRLRLRPPDTRFHLRGTLDTAGGSVTPRWAAAAGGRLCNVGTLVPRLCKNKRAGEVSGQKQVMESHSSSHFDRCGALLQCINRQKYVVTRCIIY